ncbi:hypothetical protein BR93DRAFT_940338 [Coniochaeta sp. PMI_546]|nr:hypothetical protein BR93DRAFT_940338 [Coniochaeta sp. PMI_546]
MSVKTSFVSLLALKAVGAHIPRTHVSKLPECSLKYSSPCTCTTPSYYYETVTLGIIGAPIDEARILMNDFYDTYWYAHETPINKIGPDNTVGSIRTFREPMGDLSEQLMVYKVGKDGSFEQRYQQYIDPVSASNGTRPGFYVGLEGKGVFQNETVITIKTYGCWTGLVPNLTQSHEQRLQNAIDILEANGKLTGITPTPFMSASFPKNASSNTTV